MKSALEPVEPLIRVIRGERVILDADLARLYGVPTKALNQAVKRNLERFPGDFMFRLSADDVELLNRSQIVTGSQKHRDPRLLPHAFTEHGAIMAANVLNCSQAVQMSVFVVRAFIKMRGVLNDTRALARKLADLEAELTSRLDVQEIAIVEVLQRVMNLIDPPPEPERPKREMGFHVKITRESGTKGKSKSKP